MYNSSLRRFPGVYLFLVCVLPAFALAISPVRAAQPEPPIPPEFYLVSEDFGLKLYRKDYAQGSPDYVQVIDLSQGAGLTLMHGQLGEPRKGKGMFGGDDYRFSYQSLRQFWGQAAANEKATCVFNGLFFYMPESPTRLAMPLKVDGEIVTMGFGYRQYGGEELMLELWPGEARISELNESAFYASTAPNIIAGLSEIANKRAKYSVGRTFVGVDDRDSDGIYETVLVINTLSATQAHAASVLREWGADRVMMLDGGGSTQLYCQDGWKVESERLIPQAIAVVAGSGPPYVAEFPRLPSWPVILAQTESNLVIEIHNRGSQAWLISNVEIRIEKSPWGSPERVELPKDVQPNQSVSVTWSADHFFRSGVYHLEMQLFQNGRAFPGEPAEFSLIVLPSNMEEQRLDLEQQVVDWKAGDDLDVETNARAWLQDEADQKLPAQEPQIFAEETVVPQFGDVIWVPLLMLPFVAILMLLFSRSRRIS